MRPVPSPNIAAERSGRAWKQASPRPAALVATNSASLARALNQTRGRISLLFQLSAGHSLASSLTHSSSSGQLVSSRISERPAPEARV